MNTLKPTFQRSKACSKRGANNVGRSSLMLLLILLSCGEPSNTTKAEDNPIEEGESFSEKPVSSISQQQSEVREARKDLSCIKQYLHTEQIEDYEEYEKANCLR